MSKRRTLLVALVVILAYGLFAGVASARSVTVKIKTDNYVDFSSGGSAYCPHVTSGWVAVYGPNGYYRAQTVYGITYPTPYTTTVKTWDGAPTGPYRIRYVFSAGKDSSAGEANQYPTMSWYNTGLTATFQSP